MSHRIIAVAGAAAFLIGLSAAAQAQDVAFSTAPVAITSCSVATSYDSRTLIGPLSFGTAQLRANNNLNVGYIDKNNVPATSVTVVLSEGSVNQTFVANGTFAPHVQIDRNFSVADGNDLANASCNVAQVRFADGTTWHAASNPVASR